MLFGNLRDGSAFHIDDICAIFRQQTLLIGDIADSRRGDQHPLPAAAGCVARSGLGINHFTCAADIPNPQRRRNRTRNPGGHQALRAILRDRNFGSAIPVLRADARNRNDSIGQLVQRYFIYLSWPKVTDERRQLRLHRGNDRNGFVRVRQSLLALTADNCFYT